MSGTIDRIAAIANACAYDLEATKNYIDGAPHIKHASLRRLYATLLANVYAYAAKHSAIPHVLDLGAGEGSVTLPLLELGARVTAVDISPSQLQALADRCEKFSERLQIRCADITEAFRVDTPKYDVVVANSLLHHIPDYLGMLREASTLLTPHGQFFSFQDPLRYDSIGLFGKTFTDFSYLSWRLFKGDVWGGLKRRLRRSRGIYLPESMHDNTEYHVTRNGVDQEAISLLFQNLGMDCEIVRYFSTQSRTFQAIGASLGIINTFATIARKSG